MAKTSEEKQPAHTHAREGLPLDEIIDMIVAGEMFRPIAAKYKVSITTLHRLLTEDGNAEKAAAALSLSASQYADKAEEALMEIGPDSTPVEVARARELAQHYRWKASKRNPKQYGEKVQQEHSGTITNVNTTPEEARAIAEALNKEV